MTPAMTREPPALRLHPSSHCRPAMSLPSSSRLHLPRSVSLVYFELRGADEQPIDGDRGWSPGCPKCPHRPRSSRPTRSTGVDRARWWKRPSKTGRLSCVHADVLPAAGIDRRMLCQPLAGRPWPRSPTPYPNAYPNANPSASVRWNPGGTSGSPDLHRRTRADLGGRASGP
jgi:hypothetical protein